VKVLVDAHTKQLRGVGIVGPQASDLVAEATLALEMGAFTDDIGLTVHAHPTLPEALMEAVKHAVGEAVHTLNQPLVAR
jgi:dihydrolipoamide dehydrogenase